MIFPPIEPAHGDDAAGVAQDLARGDELIRKVVEKGGFCHGGDLWFIVGWHFAGVDGIEHLLPGFRGLHVLAEIEREIFQVHVPLFHQAVVAFEAVGFKKLEVFFREFGYGRGGLREGSERHRQDAD